jgi:hypothetical protein
VPVQVLFYPVPRGTQPVPYENPFCLRNWDQLEQLDTPTLGTKYDAKIPYYGPLPNIPPGTPCGTAEQWSGQIDYATYLAGGYSCDCPFFTLPVPGFWFLRRDLAAPPVNPTGLTFGAWDSIPPQWGQYQLLPVPGKKALVDFVSLPSSAPPPNSQTQMQAQYWTLPLPALVIPASEWFAALAESVLSLDSNAIGPCAWLTQVDASFNVKNQIFFGPSLSSPDITAPTPVRSWLRNTSAGSWVIDAGDSLCLELGQYSLAIFGQTHEWSVGFANAGPDVVTDDAAQDSSPGTWVGFLYYWFLSLENGFLLLQESGFEIYLE